MASREDGKSKRLREARELLEEIAGEERPPVERYADFPELYEELDAADRRALLRWLAVDLEVKPEKVGAPLQQAREAAGDAAGWSRALSELRRAIASPRRRVLERLLNVSDGMKLLLDLRADVLEEQRLGEGSLDALDQELATLLNGWFRQGFLFLKEISTDSPYRQIRFLKDHDMVHPMVSIEEMGRRLGGDRRCFALYHCVMPEVPVVFIEVALGRGVVRSIHDILDEAPAEGGEAGEVDAATFYSINNTQNGLAGLGLGKVLVFRVMETLSRDLPGIHTLATLSPMPGFWRRFLEPVLRGDHGGFETDREAVAELFSTRARKALIGKTGQEVPEGSEGFTAALHDLLAGPGWVDDPQCVRWLEKPLLELGHRYLSRETDGRGRPLDPVANFHLGNGATVSAANLTFLANRTPRGVEESCTLMVNYVYSSTWYRQLARSVKALLPWGG